MLTNVTTVSTSALTIPSVEILSAATLANAVKVTRAMLRNCVQVRFVVRVSSGLSTAKYDCWAMIALQKDPHGDRAMVLVFDLIDWLVTT